VLVILLTEVAERTFRAYPAAHTFPDIEEAHIELASGDEEHRGNAQNAIHLEDQKEEVHLAARIQLFSKI